MLDVSVKEEACPNDLAPTASTTAALAMGDALAVVLLEKRNFNVDDFAFFHPGGAIGKRLIKIDEIMFTGDKVPKVGLKASLPRVILEITKKRFGCTCVVDKEDKLVGIITDGDLRRLIRHSLDIEKVRAKDIMNSSPKYVPTGSYASAAKRLMENHNIMQIVVVDDNMHPAGMVHLHDLLEAGMDED